MDHPFLSVTELSELPLEDIQEKITELTVKLSIAHGTNNPTLIYQVSMALESYNLALEKKFQDMAAANKDSDDNFDDMIDIS